MVYLSFRFDDPSPVSDKNVERELIKLFYQHSLPLTMAVVPFIEKNNTRFKLNRETSPHLYENQKNGNIEIVLHGHSHKQRANSNRGIPNEFAGLADKEQHKLIKEALDQLESFTGEKIDGFVPPWNTYDIFTLEALNELNFTFISAGYPGIIRHANISVIPATANLKTARETIKEAIRFKIFSPVVIINFHPDDFFEHRDSSQTDSNDAFTSLHELKLLLEEITTNKDINVMKLKDISKVVKTGKTHISEIDFLTKLPWRLKSKIPSRICFTSKINAILGAFFGIIH